MNKFTWLFKQHVIVPFIFFIQFTYAQVWAPMGLGTNNTINAMIVYNGRLIAAGAFTTAGGQNVNHIASWNGTSWQPLGLGTNGNVNTLTIYQSILIAGGEFTTAGGIPASKVALWNDNYWSVLNSTSIDGDVYALTVLNTELIAGGSFNSIGPKIAKWTGNWIPLGAGFNNNVYSLGVLSSQVYAGGSFTASGVTNVKKIAVWNGSVWGPVGAGMDDGNVYVFALYSGGLAVGGTFTSIGGSYVNRIARWNGFSWSPLGSGFDNGVLALYSSGLNLYAGGNFNFADFLPASKVAVYNGSGWAALGSGVNGPTPVVNAVSPFGGNISFGGSFNQAGGNIVNNAALWGSSIGIKHVGGYIPQSFKLEQNYPNPFNPVTAIRFNVPETNTGNVNITVFDINGKEIFILVNNSLVPGIYEVNFDASNLSSGAYFYRLTAGNSSTGSKEIYSETKRMIVLK